MDLNFLNKKDEELPTKDSGRKVNKNDQREFKSELKAKDSAGNDNRKKFHFTHVPKRKGGSDVMGVDLMPQDLKRAAEAKKRSMGVQLGLVVVIMLLACLAGYLVLNHYQQSYTNKIQSLSERKDELNAERAKIKNERDMAAAVDAKVNIMEGMLEYHVYWTPVLEKIEQLTMPTVTYTSITADVSSIKLTVMAPTYEVAAKQLYYLQTADFVENYSVNSLQVRDQDTSRLVEGESARTAVLYNITLEVKPDVFLAQATSETNQSAE